MGRKNAEYDLRGARQLVHIFPGYSIEGYQLVYLVTIITQDDYGFHGYIEFTVESEERLFEVYNRLTFLDCLEEASELVEELGNDEIDNYYWSEWTHDGDIMPLMDHFVVSWVDRDGALHDVGIENLKEPESAKKEDGTYIINGAIASKAAISAR